MASSSHLAASSRYPSRLGCTVPHRRDAWAAFCPWRPIRDSNRRDTAGLWDLRSPPRRIAPGEGQRTGGWRPGARSQCPPPRLPTAGYGLRPTSSRNTLGRIREITKPAGPEADKDNDRSPLTVVSGGLFAFTAVKRGTSETRWALLCPPSKEASLARIAGQPLGGVQPIRAVGGSGLAGLDCPRPGRAQDDPAGSKGADRSFGPFSAVPARRHCEGPIGTGGVRWDGDTTCRP